MTNKNFWCAWLAGLLFGFGFGVVLTAIYYLANYPCITN